MKFSPPTLEGKVLPIFPCNKDKKPLTPHGFKDATTDPNKIRSLFRSEDILVGVPTGEVSGFDVLDIDPSGLDWLKDHQDLLSTRWHSTRRNGYHLLYKHSPGLKGSASRIAPGIDVRADGGYIIWWPHSGLGSRNEDSILDWPLELLKLARASKSTENEPNSSHGHLNPRKLIPTPYTPYSECLKLLERQDDEVLVEEIIHELMLSFPLIVVSIFKSRFSREYKYAVQAATRAMLRLTEEKVGERNNSLNREAFYLGKIIPRMWTEPRFIIRALIRGARNCQLVQADGYEKVIRTIISGISSGMKTPHPDLD